MMTNGVTTSPGNPATLTDRGRTTKDQFLKLLLAQLKNQDPLQPPDATKFAEQMTSFGQLEQLFNLNDSMSQVASQQANLERTQASSMLGMEVETVNDQMEIGEGPAEIGVALGQPAETVEVDVIDSMGRTLRTVQLNQVGSGPSYHAFDGLDDQGEAIFPGKYRLKGRARTVDGQEYEVPIVSRGTVNGLFYDGQETYLTVGTRQVPLKDVVTVSKKQTPATA